VHLPGSSCSWVGIGTMARKLACGIGMATMMWVMLGRTLVVAI